MAGLTWMVANTSSVCGSGQLIESINPRPTGKATAAAPIVPTEQAAMKVLYLAIRELMNRKQVTKTVLQQRNVH
jgi:transposase-like protein